MTAALATDGLGVRYGGVVAVEGVDLSIEPGELVGLIGPNGAGKTSFIDAVTGFARCVGAIRIAGHDVTRATPEARARLGLARTWQAANLFEDLSVLDNLAAVERSRSRGQALREILTGRSADSGLERHLELLGIGALAHARPRELSHGRRTLVGVARALVGDPQLILLDEPGAGLDVTESRALGEHLRTVVDSGPAMLLVDHDMSLVLSTCDRVVVLEFGRVIAHGTPQEIRRDPRVIEAYLGDVPVTAS